MVEEPSYKIKLGSIKNSLRENTFFTVNPLCLSVALFLSDCNYRLPNPKLYKLGLENAKFSSNKTAIVNGLPFLSLQIIYNSIEYLMPFRVCSEGYLK